MYLTVDETDLRADMSTEHRQSLVMCESDSCYLARSDTRRHWRTCRLCKFDVVPFALRLLHKVRWNRAVVSSYPSSYDTTYSIRPHTLMKVLLLPPGRHGLQPPDL